MSFKVLVFIQMVGHLNGATQESGGRSSLEQEERAEQRRADVRSNSALKSRVKTQ